MTMLRRTCCALLTAVLLHLSPVSATSYTTDQSDLWWNPNESGWGIQLVHRGTIIFATMFVYGFDGNPTWYVATITPEGGGLTWSGDLYATTGPYFGAVPFTPATVTRTKVGTLTWTAQSVDTGTLVYRINGVLVTKSVTRQTLVNDDFNGRYGGAVHQVTTGCLNPANNGTSEFFAVLAAVQNGAAISLVTTSGTGNVCTYTGTLSQAGQMGSIGGTYNCNSGDSGTFTIFELQVNVSGITGRLAANSGPSRCAINGWFGGMRGTTF